VSKTRVKKVPAKSARGAARTALPAAHAARSKSGVKTSVKTGVKTAGVPGKSSKSVAKARSASVARAPSATSPVKKAAVAPKANSKPNRVRAAGSVPSKPGSKGAAKSSGSAAKGTSASAASVGRGRTAASGGTKPAKGKVAASAAAKVGGNAGAAKATKGAAAKKVAAKAVPPTGARASGATASKSSSDKSSSAKASSPKAKATSAAPVLKSGGKSAPGSEKAVSPKAPAKKSGKRGRALLPKDSTAAANPRSVIAAAISQADDSGYVVINGRRVRMISTKGLSIPKRAKVVAAPEIAPEAAAERIRAIKTKLSAADLKHYRTLLLERRSALVGTLTGMEEQALRSNGGNLSNMPLHMADIGSDTYEQDFTLGMAEAERQLLSEIDAALQRIANRSYGVCQMTGKPIPKARLNAKPWAKYTIEAARLVEAGHAR
jgi:RNA polymerase-binding protein DksA